MKTQYKIAILGILAIFALEMFALSQGVNGAMFAAATAGIGAISGYVIRPRKQD